MPSVPLICGRDGVSRFRHPPRSVTPSPPAIGSKFAEAWYRLHHTRSDERRDVGRADHRAALVVDAHQIVVADPALRRVIGG